jgi:DNA-binding MarR family transcriptional regulator
MASLRDEVLGELRALSTAVDALDQAAADRLGINRTDLLCLDFLAQLGPVPVGRLAAAVTLTTAAATLIADRLEHAGYVRRRPDPVDRRRVVVEFTEPGLRRARAIFATLQQSAGELVDSYSDDERRVVRDFLRGTRAMLNQQVSVLREPASVPAEPKTAAARTT